MGTTAAIILCSILLFAGALGVILPFLPGVPLAWLGIFIYALVTDFETISVTVIIVFFALALATLVFDFIAPMLGARQYRASKLGMLGALIGSVAGIFAFGFAGIIIGPLIGAFAGELLAKRHLPTAFGSTLGALVGCIVGSLFKLVLILIMTGFFIASLL